MLQLWRARWATHIIQQIYNNSFFEDILQYFFFQIYNGRLNELVQESPELLDDDTERLEQAALQQIDELRTAIIVYHHPNHYEYIFIFDN